MKYMPGFTDFFMSPVTGRILLSGFPDLTQNYTWIGGIDDRPIASPIIIDLRLEIIELRNRLSRTRFILQTASPHFDSSQALDELIPGILQHTDGVISIATILPIDILPDLPYHKIWIGDVTNRPVAEDRIWDDGVGNGNLPAYTSDEYKKIWRMDADGVPILTDALSLVEIQLELTVELTLELQLQIELALELIIDINLEITAILEAIVTINADIVAINEAIILINTNIVAINTAIGIINANIASIFSSITEINTHLGDIDLGLVDLQAQIDAGIESGMIHLADLQAQIDAGIESGMDHLAEINDQFDAINIQITDINTAISDIVTSIGDGIVTLIGDVTGSGNVGTPIATTITTTLDQIPLALGDISANINLITDVVDPVDPQDAATKNYVDGLVGDGTITLLGDVTGAGVVGTPFATTLTLTLDQVPLALGDISANINKITDLVDPVDPQDAATKNYVDDLVGDGSIELTGNVLGVGVVGTPFNTALNSNIVTTTGDQTFSYPSASSSTAFALINTFTPTLLTPSNMEFTLENSIGSGFQLLLTSSIAGGLYPDGIFDFYAFTSGGSTHIYRATSDLFTFQIPVTMTTDMSMAANKITNVTDPTSAQDAATKNYVDTRTVTLIGEVTGSGDLGTDIVTTVVGPVSLPFTFYTNADSGSFDLVTNFTPVIGDDSQVQFAMLNSLSNGVYFQFNTTYAGGSYPEGVFQALFESSTATLNAYNIFPTFFEFVMPVTMTSTLDMGSNFIHNVTDPVSAQDAATKNYVDDLVGDGSIELTGNVLGVGVVGTPFNTDLNSTISTTTGGQTFSYPSASSSTAFSLVNTFTPVLLTPSNMELTLENSIGSGFQLLLTSSHAGGTFPDGIFDFYAFTSGGSTHIYRATSDLFTFQIPVTMTTDMSMAANKITNVTNPTSAQDAATKNYVDTRTITLTGDVTGSNTLGSSIATTLAGIINKSIYYQQFNYDVSLQNTIFDLVNNFVPTIGNPSAMVFRLINANGYVYQFFQQTDSTDPQGTFYFQSSTSALYSINNTSMILNIPLNMNSHLINNVTNPVSAQDAATKNYVDGRTITLTGDVTGTNTLGSSIATTLASSISRSASQTFSFTGLQLSYFQLLNTYVPTGGNPSYGILNFTNNSGYVYNIFQYTDTGDIQGTLKINSTTTNTQLWTLNSTSNVLYVPLDMNSHKINNVTNPTSAQDAATKNYVDTKTLDTFALAAANVNINTHKLTNVVDPTSAQDAATKNYVDTGRSSGIMYDSSASGSSSITSGSWATLNVFDTGNGTRFTLLGNNQLQYTGTQTANVMAVATITFSVSANSDVYLGIAVNGASSVSTQNAAGYLSTVTGTKYTMTVSSIHSLSTNDYLSVYVFASVNITMTTYVVNMSVITN